MSNPFFVVQHDDLEMHVRSIATYHAALLFLYHFVDISYISSRCLLLDIQGQHNSAYGAWKHVVVFRIEQWYLVVSNAQPGAIHL